MKKIIQYIALVLFAVSPFVSHAQVTGSACTGEIRTDLVAATDCINKATAQGQALGYKMSCTVEQLGLGGFTDPTSGKDYILNPVCTVNGSTGHGAYLLAGFTAAPGSTAIIQSVNPGWDILKTELGYESAFAQCGGKAPYYVNGAYTCTAPPGALPLTTPPGGSTKSGGSDAAAAVTAAGATQNMYKSIFSLNQKLTQLVLSRYDDYAQTMLNSGSSSSPSAPASPSTNSSCYVFTKNLANGDSGTEVLALSYALKHDGFLPQTTSVFDTTVMAAVKRFQEAHATEILNILGLTQGTGVVAEKTRAYLNSVCIVPSSVVAQAPVPAVSPSCPAPVRTGIKNGKYVYMFKQNSDTTWTVMLNNLAYSTPSDPYYVPSLFSFTATNALDLNRQNQGKFNYLVALPGTAEGNTEYANLFGSFNNAYYDWDALTKSATSTCK